MDGPPKKKFIPLAPTGKIPPPQGLTFRPPTPNEALTGSCLIPKPIAPPAPVLLPDIYTTCPELRQFKPILDIEPPSRPPAGGGGFDPTESILKPYFLLLTPATNSASCHEASGRLRR
jgi:hypothetical protein